MKSNIKFRLLDSFARHTRRGVTHTHEITAKAENASVVVHAKFIFDDFNQSMYFQLVTIMRSNSYHTYNMV